MVITSQCHEVKENSPLDFWGKKQGRKSVHEPCKYLYEAPSLVVENKDGKNKMVR